MGTVNKKVRGSWKRRGGVREFVGGSAKSDKSKVMASDVVMLSNGVKEEDRIKEMEDRVIDAKDGWINYLSKDDSFMDGMLALLENSGTLASVIKQKVVLVVSGGLVVMNGRVGVFRFFDRVKEFISGKDKDVEELNVFLSSVNGDGEDVVEVIAKGVDDFCAMGNGFFEMVKGNDKELIGDEEGGGFFYLNHWDVSKCRIRKEVRKDGKLVRNRQVGINEDWRADVNGDNAVVVDVYPHWTKMEDGTERSVIHVKEYMRGFKYWGVPEWLAVKKWAELEYRVAAYNVAKFVNGYMPSCIVQFFGSKSKAEAKKVVDDMKKNFTDTGNNSKMFVQVVSDEKYKANVQVIEDKSDGSFMELTGLAVQRIVTGMRWAMVIAGVETSGKLGGNQQVQKEYERVNNMVINPIRERFVKNVVEVLVEEAGVFFKKEKWLNYRIQFGNNSVFSLMDSIKVDDILSLNEKREIIGVRGLSDEEKVEFYNDKKGKL